jgi:predicted aspartyl protease
MSQLHNSGNLQVLPEHIEDESVDLIYLDPPSNSNRDDICSSSHGTSVARRADRKMNVANPHRHVGRTFLWDFLSPLVSVAIYLTSAVLTMSANAAEVREVQCEFIDNVIYLPVRINGQGPFFMTLDTGTNPSAIDVAKAKQLGLELKAGRSPGRGFGDNAVVTQTTVAERLDVAGVEAANVEFDALDLSAAAAHSAKPIVGLLGYSFLKGRIFEIDYPHQKLRFNPVSEPAGKVLPMILDANVPTIEIAVSGKKVQAVIDTGGSYNLLLTPEAVKKLGVEKEVEAAKPVGGGGYAGEQQVRLGSVPTLAVGPFSSGGTDTVFAAFGKQSPFTIAEAGLGTFFLRDFAITFDYRNKTIALRN